jgi:hypothetical protein
LRETRLRALGTVAYLELSSAALRRLVLGESGVAEEEASGELRIAGDVETVGRLFAALGAPSETRR